MVRDIVLPLDQATDVDQDFIDFCIDLGCLTLNKIERIFPAEDESEPCVPTAINICTTRSIVSVRV